MHEIFSIFMYHVVQASEDCFFNALMLENTMGDDKFLTKRQIEDSNGTLSVRQYISVFSHPHLNSVKRTIY